MATNEYGLDVSYFNNLFKRELSSLGNYKPDELARVLMRAAVTAAPAVLNEAEFRKYIPIENELASQMEVVNEKASFKVNSFFESLLIAAAKEQGMSLNDYIQSLKGEERLMAAKFCGGYVGATFENYDHPLKAAYLSVASDMVFKHILENTRQALEQASVPDKFKETHHVLLAEISNALHNS